ncbi:type I secretion system permease/ATPase [Shimia thalassica]|uniref:type I secretion system permease/ATPase n=1 Tax=Shimia thalassica TaxID=1715693 RepID=UPI001C0801D8|nr:type I secretion system permease/ATPase [Shimia thalassica]MBU2943180.1 type I secretion system permease/ATPase [Shimia thalassica]MDO6505175.1 type I secretion system permease/ATPase [Shimia thalassica]
MTKGTGGKAASAQEWDFARISADPLVQAMAVCARLNGHDIGTEGLLAGVALPSDGMMTPALAVSTLEQHGFRAHLTKRKLSAVPDGLLPTVLFMRNREACVLVERLNDSFVVIWPTRSDEQVEISREDFQKLYAGHLLIMRRDMPRTAQEAEAPKTPRHWYWSVAGQYWPEYFQVILASVLVNVLGLAVPIFTMNVYDRVFPTAAITTLWSLVAAVGVALVFDAILKWIRSSVVDNVGRNVDQAVSASIFRHLSDLELQQAMQPAGALINTLKDYEQVRDFFSSQTLATLTDLCFSFLFIAVIAYLGGPLAYPPAIALVVIITLGVLTMVPLRGATNASRQSTGIKNAVAVEALTELETLKSIAGQGRMQARWEQYVAESARVNERSKKIATFSTTVTSFVQQASSIGIVIIGVYLAFEGSLTMGAVIAAMILSGRALAPTASLASLFTRASFAFSTLRSLNTLMESPSQKPSSGVILNAGIDLGAYDFKDVSLEYPGTSVPALKEVSFSASGLERIGIIGPVGAGKTSLVRLMSGLYHPTSGLATLDSLNIAQLGTATLRRDVQLVTQNAVLFSGTLAENIAFGMPQATVEDVLRVARMTGVDQLAAKNPMGFAMQIAERGANLSGGQRQMIALARALLPKPRVLILDEPTSSMDTATEQFFVERLKRILSQRPMTLVVSTHRTSLLALVDRIMVLEDGQLKMDGARDTVLASLKVKQK